MKRIVYECMLHLLAGFTDANLVQIVEVSAKPQNDIGSKCPDLDRRITSARSKIAVHIPKAIHGSGVSICPQRRVLHGGTVVYLECKR